MRRGNWISGGLALALIFSLAGCSLAQPERPASGLDEFIGFYLVYEDAMVPPSEQYEADAWVSVGNPLTGAEYVLEGEKQEDWSYAFGDLEGLDFFFPSYEPGHTHPTGPNGEEEPCVVRLSESEIQRTEMRQNTSEAGTSYICSGTVYVGPVLEGSGAEDTSWVMALYPVFQRWDGSIYLSGDAQRVGGSGGVTIGRDTKTATQINGGESAESAGLEVNVSIEWTQRLESVTVQQYSGEQALLGEDTLTAQEAMALDGTWSLPWAEGAAYTLAVKRYAGGTEKFEMFPEPYEEDHAAPLTVWFLDERGMGVPVTVELETKLETR